MDTRGNAGGEAGDTSGDGGTLCVTLHGSSSILNENRDLEYANERENQYAGDQRGETGEE